MDSAIGTTPADDLLRARLAKLERLRELGVEPFPTHFRRTHTTAAALAGFGVLADDAIAVAGRIVGRRVMGRASFCHIQDGRDRKSTRLNSSHR